VIHRKPTVRPKRLRPVVALDIHDVETGTFEHAEDC